MHKQPYHSLPERIPLSEDIQCKHADKKDEEDTEYSWEPKKESVLFSFHYLDNLIKPIAAIPAIIAVMNWKIPIALRNITGNIQRYTKIYATTKRNTALHTPQKNIHTRFVLTRWMIYTRRKLPIRMAGIRYTRNIVNGQKTSPLATVAILGSMTIGMMAEYFLYFRAMNIRRRFTILPTSNCGPPSRNGTKKSGIRKMNILNPDVMRNQKIFCRDIVLVMISCMDT